MRQGLFGLLMGAAVMVPAAGQKETQEAGRVATRIDTRYGSVDVVDRADTVDIRFRGEVVRSLEAPGASLFRVPPRDGREFVIVDAMQPGLHCRHVFVLVEIAADGEVVASNPFGECKELKGVAFKDGAPLIRLADPVVAGQGTPPATTDFESRDGNIVQVAGAAPVPALAPASPKPAGDCAAAAEAAQAGGSAVDARSASVKVGGQGRLPFLSAPSAACRQPGVFVIPGDTLRASRRFDAYTFVHYVNPRNGNTAQGWVSSSRLVGAPTP
jgi:hypothetical protein